MMMGFFFNDTATTEIYTLSLHDALPIFPVAPASRWPHPQRRRRPLPRPPLARRPPARLGGGRAARFVTRPHRVARSEEHTSELQSRQYLVCRLLLEKNTKIHSIPPARRS